MDLAVNARLRSGLLLQGGVSTGRSSRTTARFWRSCRNRAARSWPAVCRTATRRQNFLTQLKFLGVLHPPEGGRGAQRLVPEHCQGPQISANRGPQCGRNAPLLGRASPAANDRDGELSRAGHVDRRSPESTGHTVGQDPAFSADAHVGEFRRVQPVQSEHGARRKRDLHACRRTTPARWRVPTSIITARFAKFSVQFDF